MVNESFDTTTNRTGERVNLPSNVTSSPFAISKQASEGRSPVQGRSSTGSAGGPQYAQVQNPFQAATGMNHQGAQAINT